MKQTSTQQGSKRCRHSLGYYAVVMSGPVILCSCRRFPASLIQPGTTLWTDSCKSFHRHWSDDCLQRTLRPSVCNVENFRGDVTNILINQRDNRTPYTIDDKVCPPTQSHVLVEAVQKACRSIDMYLSKKPLACHTQLAFDNLLDQIVIDCWDCKNIDNDSIDNDVTIKPWTVQDLIQQCFPDGIILDSGCGTGRSTKLLAERNTNHLVLGIDKSIVRLTKNKSNQDVTHKVTNTELSKNHHGDGNKDKIQNVTDLPLNQQQYTHKIARNAYLIRAELIDFWRCCIHHDLNFWTRSGVITHHYLLYPNPYPTSQRLTHRWYAHPSFPLLLQLNAKQIIVRSNWKVYTTEFAKAVEIAHNYYESLDNHILTQLTNNNNYAAPYLQSALDGPHERRDKSIAFTNFEAKYDRAEEPTFELILYHKKINSPNE